MILLVCLFAGSGRAALPVATEDDAPQYLIDHWTTADGLPVNGVNRVVLAQSGYLWLATFDGLVRFDGHQFTVFRAGPANPGLSGNRIVELVETRDGQLWLRTEAERLVRFDGQAFHTIGPADGLPDAHVEHMALDAADILWVTTPAGVARRGAQNHFVRAADSQHLVSAKRLLTTDPDTLRIATGTGVIAFRNGRTVQRRAADGSVWRNEQGHLQRNGHVVLAPPCGVNDFVFGAGGAVWVATTCSGIYQLRPRHIFTIRKLDEPAIGSTYSLAQAPDGGLWISTRSNGVVMVSPTGEMTQVNGLKSGLGNGMYVVSIDTSGETWVGSCRVQAGGHCSTAATWPRAAGLGAAVQAIHRARDGSLWVGGLGLWLKAAAGEWQNMSAAAGLGGGTMDERVRAILEVEDGSLWFATKGAGVLRRDPNGHFRLFTVADGLASNAIRALRMDRHQQLWIATQDRGLCRMQAPHSPRPQLACLDSTRGLWSDSLHQILFDDAERMWLNSNSGIFALPASAVDAVLDGRADRVYPQVYTERDGLPSREGNGGIDHAGIRLADGRFAFPTQGGVAVFNPADLPPPQGDVRAVIERITLPDGRTVGSKPTMTMARGVRGFTVHYTGLAPNLTAPTYFRYRVLPDVAWIDLGDARQLSLSRLSSGSMTVELVALGSNGKAGSPTRITLDLPPYWYETRAFRNGMPLLLLLIMAWWFWHLRRAGLARQQHLECSVEERTAELHGALNTVNQQRDEIERLAMSKTRFFANVSHELRTPLALLTGPIDDYVRGRAPSKQLLSAMQRNGHRLERLIGQLLDLERIDARRFPLRPQTLDLSALAKESVTAFSPLAMRESISLDLHLPGHAVPVRGDNEQLMRVLGNLLSNALKFCPAGGRVSVTLSHASDYTVHLRVDDSGPGVAPDWRTRIFDRFSQMGSAATRDREGAGLGLALCREVAELHGGRLYATDSALGGAGFVFELPPPMRSPLTETIKDAVAVKPSTSHDADANVDEPAVETDAPAQLELDASTDSNQPDGAAPTDRPMVLLAEDNHDLRQYLTGILAEHYRVASAADGAMALQQARAEPPDLIVTDLMMPNLDGLGLARAIRADVGLSGVPIIFLTARAADADQIVGLDNGADYYLTKPFDSRVLLAQLGAALRACQRLRQRYAQQAAATDISTNVAPTKNAFALRLDTLFAARAHDPDFDVAAIASATHLSETALRNRCRAECAASPGELLRQHRLKRAETLLATGAGNVSEVAYAVGYVSLSAFSRAYREHYGHAPSKRANDERAELARHDDASQR